MYWIATMVDRQTILERLAALPHRVRIAVVARIIEAALPVYADWENAESDLMFSVVRTLWTYAGGEGIEPDTLDTIREAMAEAIPDMSEDISLSAPMNAGVSALYAIDSLSDLTGEFATRAISATTQAVVDAGEGDDAEDVMMLLIERTLERAAHLPGNTAKPHELASTM